MKNILKTVLTSALLNGCATDYKNADWYNTYDMSRSKAMNIVITSNIQTRSQHKLKDVPYQEYEKAMLDTQSNSGMKTIFGASLAGAKYSGSMLSTPGISDALGSSLMLLHALTTVDYDPVRYTGYVIWMPKNLARNKKEAKEYIEQLLTKAFLESLDKKYSYNLTERVHTPTFGNSTTHKHYIIAGGKCDQPETECKLDLLAKEPETDKPAPRWITNKAVYHWSSAKDVPGVGLHVRVMPKGKAGADGYSIDRLFIDDAMFLRMSKALPDWFFLYSPYSKDRAYPVVYNQGEIHYFIQPKPTS